MYELTSLNNAGQDTKAQKAVRGLELRNEPCLYSAVLNLIKKNIPDDSGMIFPTEWTVIIQKGDIKKVPFTFSF